MDYLRTNEDRPCRVPVFYVDYQNRKADYVNKFVQFLDWDELDRRWQMLAHM